MPRVALVYVVVGDPDISAATECPDCRFDALLTFPLHALSTTGVSDVGSIRACARCYDETKRERSS